jgi:inner membrane protein involved in colicin E2 resistance
MSLGPWLLLMAALTILLSALFSLDRAGDHGLAWGGGLLLVALLFMLNGRVDKRRRGGQQREPSRQHGR